MKVKGNVAVRRWGRRTVFQGHALSILWRATGSLLLLALLASCGAVPAPLVSPTPTASRRSWEWSWLEGQPCAAPCWENITPGVSRGGEVEAIWRQDPRATGMNTVSLYGKVSLSWWWGEMAMGGGIVSFDAATGIVYDVGFSCPGPCGFTLDDVIAVYGEPSHISVSILKHGPPNPGTEYGLDIFYIDKGFTLHWRGGMDVKPILDRDLRFQQVHFFVPTLEGFLATVGNAPGWEEYLFPWQGFKSFDEYICLAHREVYPELCGTVTPP